MFKTTFYTHPTIYDLEELRKPAGQTRHYSGKQLNIYLMIKYLLRFADMLQPIIIGNINEMIGHSIYIAIQLTALTCANTPTLRATNIDFLMHQQVEPLI